MTLRAEMLVDGLHKTGGGPGAAPADVTMAWVEEYRSAPSAWTAQDFQVDASAFVDNKAVGWTASNNTVTATTHSIGGVGGYEFNGTDAAEVFIRASIADLVNAGGGPAYRLTDDVLVVLKYEGVDLSGDPSAHMISRIEWANDYRPRVEAMVVNVAGTVRRGVIVENSGGAPETSVALGAVHSSAAFWVGYNVAAGTAFPRFSTTEIADPADGSVWDGEAITARQPRVDHTTGDLSAPYLKIGGYSYTAAAPSVKWKVTDIVVLRRRAVDAVDLDPAKITVNGTLLDVDLAHGETGAVEVKHKGSAIGTVAAATGIVTIPDIQQGITWLDLTARDSVVDANGIVGGIAFDSGTKVNTIDTAAVDPGNTLATGNARYMFALPQINGETITLSTHWVMLRTFIMVTQQPTDTDLRLYYGVGLAAADYSQKCVPMIGRLTTSHRHVVVDIGGGTNFAAGTAPVEQLGAVICTPGSWRGGCSTPRNSTGTATALTIFASTASPLGNTQPLNVVFEIGSSGAKVRAVDQIKAKLGYILEAFPLNTGFAVP